jgi:hypothetical protein
VTGDHRIESDVLDVHLIFEPWTESGVITCGGVQVPMTTSTDSGSAWDAQLRAEDGAHFENTVATALGRVSVIADLAELAKP